MTQSPYRGLRVALGAMLLLSACATTRIENPSAVDPLEGDVLPLLAAQLSCDGSEIFGGSSAFHCELETCIQLAHDRSEASCTTNCARFYTCTPPLECGGEAAECALPVHIEFKSARCETGVGFYCTAACRCDCSCTREM